MQFKYVGDKPVVRTFGIEFIAHEPTKVENESVINKLSGNSHFVKVEEVTPSKTKVEKEAEVKSPEDEGEDSAGDTSEENSKEEKQPETPPKTNKGKPTRSTGKGGKGK